MSILSVGSASVAITPPVGTPMDGYFDRQGGSQGVHDDLYASTTAEPALPWSLATSSTWTVT